MNKYQLVHQIGNIFSKNPSPTDGLNKVVRFISSALKVWCSIYSYDSQAQQVSLVAPVSQRKGADLRQTFSLRTGLIGLSIRKNTLINLDDAAVHPDYHPIPGLEDTPETTPHGTLLAPLNTSNRVIGVLVLTRKQKHSFSPQTVALIKEIIPALTVFIINATIMENKPDFINGFSPVAASQAPAPAFLPDVILSGTPVTGGVVYGDVMRISSINELLDTSRLPSAVLTTPEAIEAEKKKLTAAMDKVRTLSRKTAEDLASTLSEADCNIFEMHAMMVDDPSLQSTLMGFIDQGHDITTALEETLRIFSQKYMQIQDETLRERLYDIKDVLLNLKNTADNLSNPQETSAKPATVHESKSIILVAKELLPSQLVSIPLKKLSGIVCEEGGATSHVAILARALQITMMFGVKDVYSQARPNDRLILDCDGRKCILRPSLHMLQNYAMPLKMVRERKSLTNVQESSEIIHTTTADGKPIVFAGNLALICETPAIQYYGVEEIGLYRTEFMYMLRSEIPTESEQLTLFKKLIENTKGIPITIRLLDAGGDKPIPYLDSWDNEPNPALGWRGLRFLLSNPAILQPHLRAILRAAVHGKINLLVPMVADIFDLMQIQEAITQAENDLKSQGIPYSTNYNLGIMLEIPSAIFALKRMLPYINFVSIGTNDLVQFLFAVDRGNQRVRRWYRQCNPMILKIIHDVCEQVSEYPGKTVSLCGELAGSKEMLPILLGAGLRKFSMAPAKIPELRATAAKYTISQCQSLYKELIATCSSEMDVLNFLQQKGLR